MSTKTPLAFVALLLTACTGTPTEQAPLPGPSTPSAVAPAAYNIDKHCEADGTGFTPEVIEGPGGQGIQSASTGTGDTVAVLIHQTNGKGLCGMLPLARHLAKSGVRAVAMELCSYGTSVCPQSGPPGLTGQVKTVVDKARADGAKRVVVVGSSMGGSIALRAGRDVGADAVVALSPVKVWKGECDMTTDAAKLTVPTLVALSPEDKGDLAAAKTAVPTVQSPNKVLIEAPDGHGYGMLYDDPLQEKPSEVLQRTTRWVKGEYA